MEIIMVVGYFIHLIILWAVIKSAVNSSLLCSEQMLKAIHAQQVRINQLLEYIAQKQ